MTGTLVNGVTIVIGGILGVLFRKLLPDRTRETLMQGIGVFVLLYGVKQFIAGQEPILVLLAMIAGGLAGEWLNIDSGLQDFERWLEKRFSSGQSGLSKGFIFASLVFGIGPMAITGAIADGLTGDSGILLTKAVIDGIAATAFAATLGPGVILSALTILVYQGGLTLMAAGVQNWLPPAVVVELTAVGGLLVFGIGVNILEWRRIRVPNFLPALFLIVPLVRWAPAVARFFSMLRG